MAKEIGKMEEVTRTLIEFIAPLAKEGKLVTWSQLCRTSGLDKAAVMRRMTTIKKHLESEHKVWLVSEPGVGYRRTRDYDKRTSSACGSVRRMSRRVNRRALVCMEGDPDIPDDVIRRTLSNVSALGAVELCTAPQNVKRLEQSIGETAAKRALPPSVAMDLFQGKTEAK